MSCRRTRVPGTRRGGTLFVLPAIPDELDEATKNALAARNRCATEGRCPMCGTTPELHQDEKVPGVWHLVFWQEDGCPVSDEAA